MLFIKSDGTTTTNAADAVAISFDGGSFITSIFGLNISAGGFLIGRYVSTGANERDGAEDMKTTDGGVTWNAF